MTCSTEDFFAELSRSGHKSVLVRAVGTVRFDLADGRVTRQRQIDIDRGDVRITHDDTPADCVVHTSRALFDDIVTGRSNAMTAMLRGALAVEGDPELLVLVQRIFPGPPDAGNRRLVAAEGRQQP